MRILLFGSKGQVGWELERALAPLGAVHALTRTDVDLSDPISLRNAIRAAAPDVIVNAAAYTAVDAAEHDEQMAFAVNSTAPRIMAEEMNVAGGLLVHYSTDYVYGGQGSHAQAEDDAAAPLNTYGISKLAGEQAIRERCARHIILRASWIFAARGSNFLRTILKLSVDQGELRIVSDQIGAPTSARHIAAATAAILAQGAQKVGTFNIASSGWTSWHGFARAIILALGRPNVVRPIPTEAYPRPARRPLNSRINCERLRMDYGIALPHWEVGLNQCISELTDICTNGFSDKQP